MSPTWGPLRKYPLIELGLRDYPATELRVELTAPISHHEDRDSTPEQPFYFGGGTHHLPMNFWVMSCTT